MAMRCADGNRERGVALVEFAFTFPVLILLLVGSFDLGWGIYAQNGVSLAAREGARKAIIKTVDDNGVRLAAKNAGQGLNLVNSSIIISPTQAAASPYRTPRSAVTVTVKYAYRPFTPLISRMVPGGSITITSSATMVVE